MSTPTLRPELTPPPSRIARLPLDERGYPIPKFVPWEDGKPIFPGMDRAYWKRCIVEQICWACGDKLGSFKTFLLGPMCIISRTTPEPPLHLDCAEWSAINCPFLARPHMDRAAQYNTDEAHATAPGIMIARNPGVVALWTTKEYSLFAAEAGGAGLLIRVGAPQTVRWFAEGRAATRAEVVESIASGLPLLIDEQQKQDAAEGTHGVGELKLRAELAQQYLPPVFG